MVKGREGKREEEAISREGINLFLLKLREIKKDSLQKPGRENFSLDKPG